MANLEVMALDAATPQLRAPGAGDGYSMPRPMTLNFGTITTDLVPITIKQTYNNAGVDFHGLTVNITSSGGVSGVKTTTFNTIYNGNLNIALTPNGYGYFQGLYNVNLFSGVGSFKWGLDDGGLSLGSSVKRVLSSSSWYLGIDNGSGAARGLQAATLRTTPSTVALLTAIVFAQQGARSFVTDATLGIIAGLGTVVVGGGANAVPVYCDGANWIIG